eukprot:6212500-Pleurochrysis_carterae.AAC.1
MEQWVALVWVRSLVLAAGAKRIVFPDTLWQSVRFFWPKRPDHPRGYDRKLWTDARYCQLPNGDPGRYQRSRHVLVGRTASSGRGCGR